MMIHLFFSYKQWIVRLQDFIGRPDFWNRSVAGHLLFQTGTPLAKMVRSDPGQKWIGLNRYNFSRDLEHNDTCLICISSAGSLTDHMFPLVRCCTDNQDISQSLWCRISSSIMTDSSSAEFFIIIEIRLAAFSCKVPECCFLLSEFHRELQIAACPE